MKRALLLRVLLAITCASMAQTAASKVANSENAKPASPKLFFVFLNRPANAPTYSKEKGEEIQAGHMANIHRLYGEGKLNMAGPFMDDTTMRGIFVFTATSAEQVKEWLSTDPAVKAGRLEGDVHPWTPAKGAIHHPLTEPAGMDGMEKFVLLVYRWGNEAKSMPQDKVQAAFQAHMKYQLGMYEAGKTEIGGPFSDLMGGEFIGVVIAHGNQEDGEKLAAADPVVSSGVARAEVHEWITAKGVLLHD